MWVLWSLSKDLIRMPFNFPLSKLLNVRSKWEPEGPLCCTEAFNESPVISPPAPSHIFPSVSRALTKDLCCVLPKCCNSPLFQSEGRNLGGTWVGESVEQPTSAQVMILWFMSLSPMLASGLTAQSLELASASVSPSLSLCPFPYHTLSLCLKNK